MSSSDSDSDSSSSSSSTSSFASCAQIEEKSSVRKDQKIEKDEDANIKTELSSSSGNKNKQNEYDEENDNDEDRCKVFLSRIANEFNKDSIIRIFEENFGKNCIEDVVLSVKHDEDGESNTQGVEATSKNRNKKEEVNHRGFGFVTMSSVEKKNEAIDKGTIRGTAKELSKRKHTMYIRPIIRQDEICLEADGGDEYEQSIQDNPNICYLWTKFRCPYGDNCKFEHKGNGGCKEVNNSNDPEKKMKKQKCFSFRTKGFCKLGGKCPYSHDFEPKIKKKQNENAEKDPKDVDCINWKTKGKCRKGDKCPYRHDDSVREAFLAKKAKKNKTKKRGRNENAQPLSVRVFGLNYDTKEDDVREFFKDCGTIREITFPTFEDSGRSKGYCGVLFTSPKATAKATDLDGSSMHGRWLSIQGGKMYLKQWENMEKERAQEAKKDTASVGEFGQKVKRRKRHGFKEDLKD